MWEKTRKFAEIMENFNFCSFFLSKTCIVNINKDTNNMIFLLDMLFVKYKLFFSVSAIIYFLQNQQLKEKVYFNP